MNKYRKLSEKEITALEQNGCNNLNGWNNLHVKDPFNPSCLKNVTFSGNNYLGIFTENVSNKNNITQNCGIFNSHIDNCTIADNVLIKHARFISYYNIQSYVIIENVNEIITNSECTFGNGIKVCAVNEAGGREVTIYNQLSAHTAFLLCFYRHQPEFIKHTEQAIDKYADSIKSRKGTIEDHSQIYNCNSLININVGAFANINGASYLENGSINSSQVNATYVGNNVIARHFIMGKGSKLSDAAQINHCFIGEASEISSGFNAENSLFFSNSQCLLGEACSIFAGPYTVTHHKSTLLIAGNFSFFNAGSATNQSNHMYKLGPVHQGIMERGCKTGSGSYVLWPAKIGAFTLVLGKHYNNPDTSELPFSYLIEDNGKSAIMPAQNMFNVGTTRDIIKWQKRDKRKGTDHLDHIITHALTPFTASKIIDAIALLKDLSLKIKPDTKSLLHKGTLISAGSVTRGIKLYEQILLFYIGQNIIDHLKLNTNLPLPKSNQEIEKWVDLSGLPIKESVLNSFIDDVCIKGTSCDALNNFYQSCADNYNQLLLEHALQIAQLYFNYNVNQKEDLIAFLNDYIENNKKCKSAIIADAKKEFNVKTKIGFGIYGDADIKNQDFENTRGSVENNSFINDIENQYLEIENQVNEIIDRL